MRFDRYYDVYKFYCRRNDFFEFCQFGEFL